MQISDLLAALPLDRQAPEPLFRQLYGQVKAAVLRGAFGPGMQLPPTRVLCRLLGVSRQTVLSAYDQLFAEGYLTGTVGKGTFISGNLPVDLQTAAPTRLDLMRPLSARGEAYAGAISYTRYQCGELRAFRVGMPGLDLFPFNVWSRLEARRWRRPDHHMGYSDPAGYWPLREMLSVYLRASRGVRCTPEQVIITSGSQQALFLLSTLLLGPGDSVWVESPGYQGAVAPMFANGAKVCTVPVDAEGMDVAYGATNYPDARMVFATPSHQLPLGVTMSLQRRMALLRWASTNKAWIIEDDYDSEYRYTGPPLASLQSLDQNDCVVYVGTLSKVLFPGLRLGYLVAPPAMVDPIWQAKAVMDHQCGIVPQMVLADFMAGGHFGRHIKRSREAYAERLQALLNGIRSHLDDLLAIGPSDTGLDLCVHFRVPLDEKKVLAAALAAGIDMRGLSYYRNRNATPACTSSPGLLLGFACITPHKIGNAVLALAQVLRKGGNDIYLKP